MENSEYVKDQIDRYVYQVSRYLPRRNKADIEQEIRGLIDDMLEKRCAGRAPQPDDIRAVFTELGKPGDLAAKYNDSKRYLIGPALFPIYARVLLIALSIAVGAAILGIIVSVAVGTFRWEDLAGIMSAATGAFVAVTLLFGFFEWKGMSISEVFDEGKELPPVPKLKERIPAADPIVGIIFSLIFLSVILFAPEIFGYWDKSAGGFISILDTGVIRSIGWLFVISFAFTLAEEVFRLVEGRYTIRLMIAVIICDAAELALAFVIIRNFPIWNQQFPYLLMAAIGEKGTAVVPADWGAMLGNGFLAVMTFGTVVETISCVAKTIKYTLRQI